MVSWEQVQGHFVTCNQHRHTVDTEPSTNRIPEFGGIFEFRIRSGIGIKILFCCWWYPIFIYQISIWLIQVCFANRKYRKILWIKCVDQHVGNFNGSTVGLTCYYNIQRKTGDDRESGNSKPRSESRRWTMIRPKFRHCNIHRGVTYMHWCRTDFASRCKSAQ